jgi:hypothetical protein
LGGGALGRVLAASEGRRGRTRDLGRAEALFDGDERVGARVFIGEAPGGATRDVAFGPHLFTFGPRTGTDDDLTEPRDLRVFVVEERDPGAEEVPVTVSLASMMSAVSVMVSPLSRFAPEPAKLFGLVEIVIGARKCT